MPLQAGFNKIMINEMNFSDGMRNPFRNTSQAHTGMPSSRHFLCCRWRNPEAAEAFLSHMPPAKAELMRKLLKDVLDWTNSIGVAGRGGDRSSKMQSEFRSVFLPNTLSRRGSSESNASASPLSSLPRSATPCKKSASACIFHADPLASPAPKSAHPKGCDDLPSFTMSAGHRTLLDLLSTAAASSSAHDFIRHYNDHQIVTRSTLNPGAAWGDMVDQTAAGKGSLSQKRRFDEAEQPGHPATPGQWATEDGLDAPTKRRCQVQGPTLDVATSAAGVADAVPLLPPIRLPSEGAHSAPPSPGAPRGPSPQSLLGPVPAACGPRPLTPGMPLVGPGSHGDANAGVPLWSWAAAPKGLPLWSWAAATRDSLGACGGSPTLSTAFGGCWPMTRLAAGL